MVVHRFRHDWSAALIAEGTMSVMIMQNSEPVGFMNMVRSELSIAGLLRVRSGSDDNISRSTGCRYVQQSLFWILSGIVPDRVFRV